MCSPQCLLRRSRQDGCYAVLFSWAKNKESNSCAESVSVINRVPTTASITTASYILRYFRRRVSGTRRVYGSDGTGTGGHGTDRSTVILANALGAAQFQGLVDCLKLLLYVSFIPSGLLTDNDLTCLQ